MANLVTYNSGTDIASTLNSNAISVIVNGNTPLGSNTWCASYPVCNNFTVITDTYTLGLSSQASSTPLGFCTVDQLQSSLTSTISKISQKIGDGSIDDYATAISYSQTKGFFIMNQDYPGIITDGMVMNLDAGLTQSYPQIGSTWYDTSSSNNNGTLNNSPSWSTTGILGSFSFDGSNQDVSCGNFLPANYTKFVFFKLNDTTSANSLLAGPSHYFGMNGTSTLYAGNGDYWGLVNSVTVFQPNTWYCGAVTFSTTNGYKLYVNGLLEDTSDVTTGTTTNDSVFIGSFLNSNYLNGQIGISLMYNRELSAEEIATTYSSLLPRFNGNYSDPCITLDTCSVIPPSTCTLAVNATNSTGYIWQMKDTNTNEVILSGVYNTSTNQLVGLPKNFIAPNCNHSYQLIVVSVTTLSSTVFDTIVGNQQLSGNFRLYPSNTATGPTGAFTNPPYNSTIVWQIFNVTLNSVAYQSYYDICNCYFMNSFNLPGYGSVGQTMQIRLVFPGVATYLIYTWVNTDTSAPYFPCPNVGCIVNGEFQITTNPNCLPYATNALIWKLARILPGYVDSFASGPVINLKLGGLPPCYQPKGPAYNGNYEIQIYEFFNSTRQYLQVGTIYSWSTVGQYPIVNFSNNAITAINGSFVVAPTQTNTGTC